MAQETPVPEIEPLAPESAAAILNSYLANLETEGWEVLVQTDYMARLTRSKKNLEVYVDLLGEVHAEEKPLTAHQEVGRILAIVLLLVTFLLVMTLVSVLGWPR